MLDINFIRENQDLVKKAAEDKQFAPVVVEEFLGADKRRRECLQKVEAGRAEVNRNVAEIKKLVVAGGKPTKELVNKGKVLKTALKKMEEELRVIEAEWEEKSLQIPNVPAADVPYGKDEGDNQVLRKEGEIPKFAFTPKSHQELMLDLDLLDVERAVRIGGFRSYMLKNEAVLLEQGLLNYALGCLVKQGFMAMTVPVLVKKDTMVGTGYFPWGKDDHYHTQDEQILTGTAEVALTAFRAGEILNEKDLPLKMVGLSPCFRREVGAYGKDTRGIIRVHQFSKVEQVIYTVADEQEEREWHEKMLGYSEQLLKDLGLPYQVLLMCTGDMGAPHRKKYDLESWFPAQEKYRETHSASYFNDFQARRLGMRYRAKDGKTKFVYTLNNTMAASPRLLACIIENYQREDGSVGVPRVLQNLVGFDKIEKKK
jgi:seryl-tRNA synthetase